MAEALGLAASIVGVGSFALQLAESVAKLKRFCAEVKNAPGRLQLLIVQTEIMGDLLLLVAAANDETDMKIDGHPLQRCHALCKAAVDNLAAVANGFTRKLGRRRYLTAVKMALMRDEIDELVERVEQSRSLLDTARQIYVSTAGQKQLVICCGHVQELSNNQASHTTTLLGTNASSAILRSDEHEQSLPRPLAVARRVQ